MKIKDIRQILQKGPKSKKRLKLGCVMVNLIDKNNKIIPGQYRGIDYSALKEQTKAQPIKFYKEGPRKGFVENEVIPKAIAFIYKVNIGTEEKPEEIIYYVTIPTNLVEKVESTTSSPSKIVLNCTLDSMINEKKGFKVHRIEEQKALTKNKEEVLIKDDGSNPYNATEFYKISEYKLYAGNLVGCEHAGKQWQPKKK